MRCSQSTKAGYRLNQQPQMPQQDHEQRPMEAHGPQPETTCSRQITRRPSRSMRARLLRNSERNSQNLQPHARQHAPDPVAGLSRVAALIQRSDFCWPQVVGMRKGTGVAAQRHTRAHMPARKTAQRGVGDGHSQPRCAQSRGPRGASQIPAQVSAATASNA